MASWHVGQKIVCIVPDEDCWEGEEGVSVQCEDPIKGAVYTISDIDLEYPIGLLLEEIADPNYDVFYDATGFRPVRTTDISIFTKLLKPTLEKV